MDSSLDSLDTSNFSRLEREIFNIIKPAMASLDAPDASPRAARTELVHRLYNLIDSQNFLWDLWTVVIDIVQHTTIGKDFLSQVLISLAAYEVKEDPYGGIMELRYLSGLGMTMRDFWYDPTDDQQLLTEDQAARWENFNSFAARLVGKTDALGINFPIWSLRTALEEPLPEDFPLAVETRLRVATDWLLRCGHKLHSIMMAEDDQQLDTAEARSLRPGILCEEEMPPLGIDRWQFWKARLVEIAEVDKEKEESQRLSETTRKRISDVISMMKSLERPIY